MSTSNILVLTLISLLRVRGMIDSCPNGKMRCPNGRCIDKTSDISKCEYDYPFANCGPDMKWCSSTFSCVETHLFFTACSKCSSNEKKCYTGYPRCIARDLYCPEEGCAMGFIRCGYECLAQSEICRRDLNTKCETYFTCSNYTDGATKRIYYIICLVLPITLLFLVCSIMLKKYRSASRTTVVIDAPVEQLPLGRLEDGRVSSRVGGLPILVAAPGVHINVSNENRLEPPSYDEVVDDRLPSYEDILSNPNTQRTNTA
ncbi:unnamed protein product [Dimorphilus gyrociliatus]|uniref:Uncharacterized protein n=1 Tax=Dimorphilus gyrociliatus TaxID=2664684 RepID=A0A7I8V5K6_9ANNE|nr:unnamed protein product [Dimorphilus gyrociliatus]